MKASDGSTEQLTVLRAGMYMKHMPDLLQVHAEQGTRILGEPSGAGRVLYQTKLRN